MKKEYISWLRKKTTKELEYTELCPWCNKEANGVNIINRPIGICEHCGNVILICSNCPNRCMTGETEGCEKYSDCGDCPNYENIFSCTDCPFEKFKKRYIRKKRHFRKEGQKWKLD